MMKAKRLPYGSMHRLSSLWARFYTLENNQPFFSDRDGVKKFNISEIGYERRNGYSWYNSDGLKVFKKYEQWKKKHNK